MTKKSKEQDMPNEAGMRAQLAKAEVYSQLGQPHPNNENCSYEDGVVAALTWVLGDHDTPPME